MNSVPSVAVAALPTFISSQPLRMFYIFGETTIILSSDEVILLVHACYGKI